MTGDQSATIAYLSSPAAHPGGAPVEVVETHGALVFLSGDRALKLKRAVHYDYMDLSTPEKRHALLLRELELNRPAAPGIYRDVVPVTREDGGLALDGPGAPVDWVLRMTRFPAEAELTAIADRGGLDDGLAREIGLALARYHDAAPVRPGGAGLIEAILTELEQVFAEYPGAVPPGVAEWSAAARQALEQVASHLDRRGAEGHVRRGHGDLHLRNLVVLDGRPVPFDALEFDETLGTCDLLYDLGFLLMDLCHRGLPRPACRILDAWLTGFGGAEDAGLAALPLFLSVRAAIRAMVLVQTDAARAHDGESRDEIAAYLAQARDFLAPAPARLIAVGGYSGSGKSVLARALAPGLGAAPGAVLIASDAERRALADDAPPDPGRYAASARAAVYDRMMARAATVLGAGHTAILDATFLDPADRDRAAEVARLAGVAFDGFWLTAPPGVLEARVAARQGDLSEADVPVLRRQMARGTGPMGWAELDASGSPGSVEAQARARLTR